MTILVIITISFLQSVSSRTTRDVENPLTSASKSISSNGLFEHQQILEDTHIDTKQDEDLSFINVQTMILYGGLGVAALVIFLPMLVMGVGYLWMLYWFSCKGKKSFPENSFPDTSNLLPNVLGDLDYLSGAVGVANDLWSGRCG